MVETFTYHTDLYAGDIPLTGLLAKELETFFQEALPSSITAMMEDSFYNVDMLYNEASAMSTENESIEEILEENGYEYLKEMNIHRGKPSFFAFEFQEKPRMTEEFAQKMSEFFCHGFNEQTRIAFAELKEHVHGVKPYHEFTVQQLQNLKQVNDLLHDIVYGQNTRLIEPHLERINEFKRRVSEAELRKIYPEHLVDRMFSRFDDRPFKVGITEDLVVGFYKHMTNALNDYDNKIHGFWIRLYEESKYLLKTIHSSLEDWFDEYTFLIDFKENKRVKAYGLREDLFVDEDFRSPEFSHNVDMFHRRNGSPILSSDFVLAVIRYFNGGHRPEIENVLKSIFDDQVRDEKKSWVKREMVKAEPVKFVFFPENVYMDSTYRFRIDVEFVNRLISFFQGGNTQLVQDCFSDLREVVKNVEVSEKRERELLREG